MSIDGILNVNKPAGMTSHDVVARVRRTLKTKRVGHAGTLDPDATGVLVVAVGQATRLLPHLPLEPKVYRAELGFGTATDTEDASGQVIETADASGLTDDALRAVLPQFVGEIAQVPPMVSALHHNGQRLYDLARQGITVERESRTITIHAINLLSPPLLGAGGKAGGVIRVTCGGGTYIRTLCKDIGLALGLPAHMASLVREAVGPYTLAAALSLDALTADALFPMHIALGWPILTATDHEAAELKLGRALPLRLPTSPQPPPASEGGDTAVVYQGRLLALVRHDGDYWQPFKVFSE